MPVKNLRQKKNEIRTRYKKLRENYPPDKKAAADRAIAEKLFELEEFKSCRLLLAFISKDIEVDTSAIITRSLELGKRVAVPRCNDDQKTISYYYYNSRDNLEEGFYGLLEPNVSRCERVTDFSGGLCIVPGIVFDRDGYRIGFGKGYYDRFVYDFDGVTAGICYSKCMVPELPRGYYDRPVNLVITDKYTLDIRNR